MNLNISDLYIQNILYVQIYKNHNLVYVLYVKIYALI